MDCSEFTWISSVGINIQWLDRSFAEFYETEHATPRSDRVAALDLTLGAVRYTS